MIALAAYLAPCILAAIALPICADSAIQFLKAWPTLHQEIKR